MISNYLKRNDKKVVNSVDDVFAGLTGSDNTVTESNALKNSDIVYSCINLISSTISKMPISLHEETDKGKVKVNNEVSYLLKTRANSLTSAIDFKQAMIANMLLWGNSYAYIITKRGIPNELILLDPSVTRLEKFNGKVFVVTSIDNTQYKIKYEQVIHLKDLTTDGLNGISRIKAVKNKLENKMASDNLLKNFYSSGGSVKGVLNVPDNLTSEAKRKIKEGFTNILNGGGNGIAILENGMSFTSVYGTNLSDADFVNNMKLTKEDICAIFGVPTAMIGDSSNTSYNNMSEMNRNFVHSLVSIINKFEAELAYKLLTTEQQLTHYFKFNMSVALRGSDLDRADYYKKMITNMSMTINEVRELEDLPLVEGGDQILMSLNYVPMDKYEEYLEARKGSNNGNTALNIKTQE